MPTKIFAKDTPQETYNENSDTGAAVSTLWAQVDSKKDGRSAMSVLPIGTMGCAKRIKEGVIILS